MRASIRAALVAAFLTCALVAAPAAAEQSTHSEAMTGAGSALCSLIYGPVKIVYALGGGVVGGLAWLFSAGDSDVAGSIWTASFRGDYVVTPNHLNGEDSLEFVGRSPEQRRAAAEAQGSSQADVGGGSYYQGY